MNAVSQRRLQLSPVPPQSPITFRNSRPRPRAGRTEPLPGCRGGTCAPASGILLQCNAAANQRRHQPQPRALFGDRANASPGQLRHRDRVLPGERNRRRRRADFPSPPTPRNSLSAGSAQALVVAAAQPSNSLAVSASEGAGHIVRHRQIRQHLLGDALEYRPAHFAAVMRADRRIEHHQDRDRRIVHRSKTHERRIVLRAE